MKKLFLACAFIVPFNLYAADGAEVYQKCQACHGPDGKMVYATKVPAIAGNDAATIIEQLNAYKAGNRNEYGLGQVMTAQANMHLKADADIEAVAAYIAALK